MKFDSNVLLGEGMVMTCIKCRKRKIVKFFNLSKSINYALFADINSQTNQFIRFVVFYSTIEFNRTMQLICVDSSITTKKTCAKERILCILAFDYFDEA